MATVSYHRDYAYVKHAKEAQKWKSKMNEKHSASVKAQNSARRCAKKAKLDKKQASKWLSKQKKYLRSKKSADKAYKRYKSKYKSENKYLADRAKDNSSSIKSQISQHKQGDWKNEGNCAIYRADGHSANVVYISPSDTEEQSFSAEATSWPVDEGAPRSNYVRNTGDTPTVAGIITGDDRAEADKKFAQLYYWYQHNVELIYDGSFKEDHLFIQSMSNPRKNFRDNLEISITFTRVRSAKITEKSTGNNAKVKKSKSSKTTQGSRNKRYAAITIKPGDTLLGLSQKYGKSVAWLQKVNKIKNPNRIYAGDKLYVKKRVTDKAGVKKTVYENSKSKPKKVRVR